MTSDDWLHVPTTTPGSPWVFAYGFLGGLLYWCSQPPLGLTIASWLAPVPWLLLVALPSPKVKWFYLRLYAAGVCMWAALSYWVSLPHPPESYMGWAAMSFYLGLYLPVFVAACRLIHHRIGWPLLIVGPIVWVSCEWIRGRMFTGFLMSGLAQPQLDWLPLVQIADVGGQYAVDAVVMLGAAWFASLVVWWRDRSKETPRSFRNKALRPTLVVGLILGGVLGYGVWQLGRDTGLPGQRVVLVQEPGEVSVQQTPEELSRRLIQYQQKSLAALALAKKQGAEPSLLIWPESAFTARLVSFESSAGEPPKAWRKSLDRTDAVLRLLCKEAGCGVLVGGARLHFQKWPTFNDNGEPEEQGAADVFNSALGLATSTSELVTYDKRHLVMFGEYIPLARFFPFLKNLTPVAGSTTAGTRYEVLDINGTLYAPNICYESVLPHVIRRQVQQLMDDGKKPHVLVNMTNDAWFKNSNELDKHFASSRLRAIEMRTPMLVVAHGGLSGAIDANGRVIALSKRGVSEAMVVNFTLDNRESLYLKLSDSFALCCLVLTALCCSVAWVRDKSD